MTQVNETFLYIRLKRFLRASGWSVVGGQPPSGTDHIPVLEIKAGSGLAKGSLGSFKPDLVACYGTRVIVVEIKPKFNLEDVQKLREFLASDERRRNFLLELRQRGILDSAFERDDALEFEGAICHGGPYVGCEAVSTFHWEGDSTIGSFVHIKSQP